MSENCLWTVQIRGANSFEYQAPGNPSVEHDGGVSVAQLVLTQAEVGELKIYAAAAGCRVKAWPTDGQSKAQSEARTRILRLGEQEQEWPTHLCPTCSWFDPLQGGSPCSLNTYPEESIRTLRETSEAHRKSEAECPLRGSPGSA